MPVKSENIVTVTRKMVDAAIAEMSTPDAMAAFDAMTDEDIAAQIASNPDAAPELDEAWFERTRLVQPLRSLKRSAG